jgi:hypothetical protein
MHIHSEDREDFRRGFGALAMCEEQVGELVGFLVLCEAGGHLRGSLTAF